MPKRTKVDINLLPKDPFFATPVGKVLKWALSVGRYIVIFTELIVIMSFVARFNLDRQVTDLNDSINQKKNVIQSFGTLEADVRDIQRKTDQYQQVALQSNIAEIFPVLSQITPASVELDELTIQIDSIRMIGTAFSNSSFNLLVNNLQLSQDFTNITVDSVQTGDQKDPGFHFQIRAQTKRQAAAEVQTRNQPEKINILDRTQGL